MKHLPYIAIAVALPIIFLLYIISLGYTGLSEAFLVLPNETEILLFTVQAGVGAATLGHFLGRRRAEKSIRVSNNSLEAAQQKKINIKHMLIVVAVIALFVVPFIINNDAEFGGTDGQGPDAIEESGYIPWIDPVAYQPDDLGERLLFSFQVAIGAVIVGFYVGLETGKVNNKKD